MLLRALVRTPQSATSAIVMPLKRQVAKVRLYVGIQMAKHPIAEGKLPCAAQWKGISAAFIRIQDTDLESIPEDTFSELASCSIMQFDKNAKLTSFPKKLFNGLTINSIKIEDHKKLKSLPEKLFDGLNLEYL